MKKLIAVILGLLLCLVLLFVIKNQVSNNKMSEKQTENNDLENSNPTQTLTRQIFSQTPTSLPIVTETPTVSPTPFSTSITFVTMDAVFQASSSFVVEISPAVGEYYASGRIQDGGLIAFSCEFRKEKPTHLICSSGPLPFNKQINLQLYQKETNELVFSKLINYNFVLHGEVIPSPTGVICEGEPQWNGFTSAHQLEKGCFAMSCWQNGEYLWGTDNTCQVPWPFLWKYEHPLNYLLP